LTGAARGKLSGCPASIEHMVEDEDWEGLAAMTPGPGLSSRLAGLEPGRVPNDNIVDVLIAQARQGAHDQARMWAAIDEVIHRRPFAGSGEIRRDDQPDLYGADEVRAALSWTRRAADAEADLAHVVVCELPSVWTALLAGALDRGKAVVFARHLADLSPAQRERICAALVPLAARLTTGQLAQRIKRMVLEIDPAYYAARYAQAVRERKLVHYLDAEGTAVITASGLPADEAALALERVEVLARAARRAGHPGTLDQIRADLVLVLLDGSVHGMTRVQIIDALLTRYAGAAAAGGTPGESEAGPDSSTGGAGDDGVDDDGVGDDRVGDDGLDDAARERPGRRRG
jgi:hypothetical protein